MDSVKVYNQGNAIYISSKAYPSGSLTATNSGGNITITVDHTSKVVVKNCRYDKIVDKDGNAWGTDGPSTVTALNNYIGAANPDGIIKSTDKITDLTGITSADFTSKPGYTVFVGSTDGSLQTSDAVLLDGNNLRVNGELTSSTNSNLKLKPGGTGNVEIGNFEFDADQTGANDGDVLTFDSTSGTIALSTPTGGSDTNLANTNLTLSGNKTFDHDGGTLVFDLNDGGEFIVQDSSLGTTTADSITMAGGGISIFGLVYPTADGTNGQVLTTNGSGILSFATVSGGGGLGGADQTLTADRTIDTNGYNLDIELDPTGTPDTFTIHDGTHDLFQVDTSTSGDIFSVNDVSGLPEITVNTTNGVDIPNLNFYKGCISGKGGQASQATYGTQWRSSMSGQSVGRYQTSSNNSLLTFASGTPSVGDTLSANNWAISAAYLLPGINFSKINLRGNIRAYNANAEGETQHMEVWTFDQTDISGFGTTTCTFRGKIEYTFDSTSATIKPILINSDISYSGDKDTGILIVGHAPTNPSASYETVFMIEVTVT